MRITIINDVYFRKCYYFNILKSEEALISTDRSWSLTDLRNLKPSKHC